MTTIPIDFYTPWRELGSTLEMRHIGREEELRSIAASIEDFVAGRKPLHQYLFGPRGMGKSHLLSLLRHRVAATAAKADIPLIVVPEDIPEIDRAEVLVERIRGANAGPRWKRWSPKGISTPQEVGRAVVFLEGLDRHLQRMSEVERRDFRRRIDEDGPFLLVATGVGLGEALVSRDTAFFGAFQPWPINPLDEAQSAQLLDRVAGLTLIRSERWPARQSALVSLAGGSPRTLTALALSCAARPEAWAADHLQTVVQQFTAHYQMRFRDLPPQGQQIVEILSDAPREMAPVEIAAQLGLSAPAASTVCRRLFEAGVVQVRHEGRNAWYRVAEPLFRFWHEYRTAPWEETRAGWMGRLIESILEPPDIAQAWMDNPDLEMRRALSEVLRRESKTATEAWRQITDRLWKARERPVADQVALIERGSELPPSPLWASDLVRACGIPLREDLVPAVRQLIRQQPDCLVVIPALEFREAISAGMQPRQAFARLLKGTADLQQRSRQDSWAFILARDHALDALEVLRSSQQTGRPWHLEPEEVQRLAGLPFYRVTFLSRGKLPSDAPLLNPDDILDAPATADTLEVQELLPASMLRYHEGLASRCLDVLENWAPFLAHMNPRPGLPLPCRADDLTRMCAKTLRKSKLWTVESITWAATWASASPSSFSEILAAWAEAEARWSHPWMEREPCETALVALGLRARDRLDSLCKASQHPALRELTLRALTLVDQIAEGSTARLQPELARFAELVNATPVDLYPSAPRAGAGG